MINLFRKIRNNLLSEGKFSKYLVYGLGEITLVVIGILIAVQINDWNQQRIDNIRETNYLLNLKKELQGNIELSTNLIEGRMEGKFKGLFLAKQFSEGEYIIIDTLEFLSKVGYAGVSSGGNPFGSRNFYDELLNTGNLQLIKKDTIKSSIATYYSKMDIYRDRSKVHSSKFLDFISSLRPFDFDNPEHVSKYDQIEMIQAFQTDEFRKLVDHELSYAYILNRYNQILAEGAKTIIDLIDKELAGEL